MPLFMKALLTIIILFSYSITFSQTQSQNSVIGKVVYGKASFYSSYLHGSKTATGGRYKNEAFTAASNTFKLHTWVKVTNTQNGKTVIVQINDRMHKRMAKKGRVLDLSKAAAIELDFIKSGITKVKVEVIEKPASQ